MAPLFLHLLLLQSPEGCGCWQLVGDPRLGQRLAEQLPEGVEEGPGCKKVRVEGGDGQPLVLEYQRQRRSVNDVSTAVALLKSWSCPTPSATGEVAVGRPEATAGSSLRLRAGAAVGADSLGATWTGVSLGGDISLGALELSLSGLVSWTAIPAKVWLLQVGGDDVQVLAGLGWRIGFGRLGLTPGVSAGIGQFRTRVSGRWYTPGLPEPRLGLRLEGVLDAQTSFGDFGLSVRIAAGPFPQTLESEDDGPGPGSAWRGRFELALVVGP